MAKNNKHDCANHKVHVGSCSNAVYGVGLFGALVYYLQQASSFSEGFMGILKALVWPAIMVYKAMGLLGM